MVAPGRVARPQILVQTSTDANEVQGANSKRQLEKLVMGRKIECRAGRYSYDRVIGACTLGGQRLGDVLRAMGAREGGRGWR